MAHVTTLDPAARRSGLARRRLRHFGRPEGLPGRIAGRIMARRNRAAVAAGRVGIHRASAERLPFATARFTRVCSVNSLPFWPDVDAALAELARGLAPGGRLALLLRMRLEGAGALDRRRYGSTEARIREIAATLMRVGFRGVRIETHDLAGERTAAILARRDEPGGREPGRSGP